MSCKLKLCSENVYYEGRFRELEVCIEGRKISRVGKDLGSGSKELDFGDKLLIPGVIDGHVHFRDPGEPEKEDFRSGSRAAASGGVTTVVDMPNNLPPIKSPKLFEEKKRIALEKSLVNFALYAGIPEDLSDISLLTDVGAIGFKYYMATETVDLSGLVEELNKTDSLLTVHAEDPEGIKVADSSSTPAEYLDSRPPEAELVAVDKLLRHSPERLHVAHVTLSETVSKLKTGMTSEVTPHHLLLSREDVDLTDFTAVTHPPIRYRDRVSKLRESFFSNEIDMISSDHAPHRRSEKESNTLDGGSPGVPGVETILPLSLSFAWENDLPLSFPIDKLTKKPAEIFGFERRGEIREGYWADLTVVDGDVDKAIRGENFYSKGKVTPFEGRKVSFWPVTTFINGQVVHRDGKIVSEQKGDFLSGSPDG
ncbi:dihydroorotase family protein [Candidatus Bipolaricaulota bacterium]|nr:dihydroorotase family protein [Candidatus Bipolaricaulota bacterium]